MSGRGEMKGAANFRFVVLTESVGNNTLAGEKRIGLWTFRKRHSQPGPHESLDLE